MVERQLPKLDVASSSLVSRSLLRPIVLLVRCFRVLFLEPYPSG